MVWRNRGHDGFTGEGECAVGRRRQSRECRGHRRGLGRLAPPVVAGRHVERWGWTAMLSGKTSRRGVHSWVVVGDDSDDGDEVRTRAMCDVGDGAETREARGWEEREHDRETRVIDRGAIEKSMARRYISRSHDASTSVTSSFSASRSSCPSPSGWLSSPYPDSRAPERQHAHANSPPTLSAVPPSLLPRAAAAQISPLSWWMTRARTLHARHTTVSERASRSSLSVLLGSSTEYWFGSVASAASFIFPLPSRRVSPPDSRPVRLGQRPAET